ncbi:uncharacterized protein TrAFT101_002359 [Trichoderma asperellum]|uniref:uncharacterized protein n=1 Tax=Trichoderma asperellum TaxID=101201 RepID=UPI003321F97D|nr:hypothetical protein TrAFT101_002359 [Trichoderma asperellum]
MDQPHETTFNAAFPRTKNGRLVACEPCRRRKYACDRSLPTCLRCQRSRVKKPCRYVTTNPQHAQSSDHCSNNARIVHPKSPHNNLTVDPLLSSSTFETVELMMPNAPTLNPLNESEVLSRYESMPPTLSSLAHERNSLLSVDISGLQAALDVLSSLPSLEAEHILAKPHINPFNGWIPLPTTQILTELRSTYASAFQQGKKREHLIELALIIFSNTAIALSDGQHYPSEEWYTSFSGPRLRWETIGLLFSSWALYALQNKEHISQYRPRVLVAKFFNVMESCIRFCQLAKSSNIFLLYLLYRTSIVSSILHGPNNANFWRLHTETISLACSLRLHAMPDSSLKDFHIKKQSERRLFTAIYILDTTAAAFSGKSPMLTSQDCSTALPLDICDATLLRKKPNETSDLLSLGIDDYGWNTGGKIYGTTTLRERGLIANLREKILVIALNKRPKLLPDLIKLKLKQVYAFSQLPSWIQLSDADCKLKSLQPHVLYTKLFIRLEHLQNLLLIERVLHDIQPEIAQDELVEVCLEIVSVTVIFWTRNDCLVGMEGDHEWLITGYAVPAAVTLCKNLLLAHYKGSSMSSAPVSAIIQQLSLLGAFIEWLMLRVPCTDRCIKTRSLILQVLDQVLNNPPHTTTGIFQDRISRRSASHIVHPDELEDIDTFNWLK